MFKCIRSRHAIVRNCPVARVHIGFINVVPRTAPRFPAVTQRRQCHTPRCSRRPRLLALQPLSAAASSVSSLQKEDAEQCWDVVGFGQAMVDCCATVDEALLELCGVAKGDRRVISIEERGQLLELLHDSNLEVSTGGSLANTLVGLGRLSATPSLSHRKLRVGMAGSIGSDTPGQYFQAHLQHTGVSFIPDDQPPASTVHALALHPDTPQHSPPSLPRPTPSPHTLPPPSTARPSAPTSQTGTVMVLTTPDAQRSFLSFFPSDTLSLTPSLLRAVSRARALIIEGYMWELEGATPAIHGLICHARRYGTLVVLTAGDKGVVQRNRERILAAMALGVDVMFANTEEAAALLGSAIGDAVGAARGLGELCGTAIVTDGSRGSCIAALGQLHVTPPVWSVHPPVDTCGAGDAFAAGALFSLLSGCCMATVGQAGARLAASVIARRGAQVLEEDAADLGRMLMQKQAARLCAGMPQQMLGAAGALAEAAFVPAVPTVATAAVGWAR